MDIGVDALLVSIFLILPGFFASTIERIFIPRGTLSELNWAAVSVLRSLVLNAAVLLPFVLFTGFAEPETGIKDLGDTLVGKPVWQVAVYLALVYGLAGAWGLLSGIARGLSLQRLAFLRGWTRIAPDSDVWNLALGARFRTKENRKLRGKPQQEVPWMRVRLPDRRTVLGRMKYSSVRISEENPIEAYLDPVYEVTDEGYRSIKIGDDTSYAGLYLLLTPQMYAEFFSARADWLPPEPPTDELVTE